MLIKYTVLQYQQKQLFPLCKYSPNSCIHDMGIDEPNASHLERFLQASRAGPTP